MTGQNMTGKYMTGQNMTEEARAGQDRTAQGQDSKWTGQDRYRAALGLDSTGT